MTQTPHTPIPKTKGLGRGLDALFGDNGDTVDMSTAPITGTPLPHGTPRFDTQQPTGQGSIATPTAPSGQGTVETPLQPRGLKTTLPITQILPGTYQPRKTFDDATIDQLAMSIREHGIIQPLLVRPVGEGSNQYEIIAGERRWRAAQRAQLHDVPVVINAEITDRQALEMGLIENVQREDLNIFDEAAGYQRLIDEFGFTPERLGQAIGKSRAHVANTLRLLGLPREVQAFVIAGKLSAGHVRPLIGLPVDAAISVAEKLMATRASARAAEKLANDVRASLSGQGRKNPKAGKVPAQENPHTVALQDELTNATGLKVLLDITGSTTGWVKIEYRSLDQFDQIQKLLKGD